MQLTRAIAILAGCLVLSAQQQPPGVPAAGTQTAAQGAFPAGAEGDRLRLSYILDANDQIMIRVPQAEELNEKAFRIDSDGNLQLPVVGPVKASGLTLQQLEAELTKLLVVFYRSPRVSLTVVQYRGDPVIFLGAFVKPGIYPLQGRRTLVEMLMTVGGLQPNASRRLRVTRRAEWGRIPLAGAQEDRERKISSANVSISRLLETMEPEEDIVLMPYDVIRVGAEEMVYLSGDAGKSGGFPLNDRDSLSVMQLMAVSGGVPTTADPERAKVLRQILDTNRRAEIPLNVKSILEGKSPDFQLMPNDVLFIPRAKGSSVGKTVGRYAAIMLPGLATSLLFITLRRN